MKRMYMIGLILTLALAACGGGPTASGGNVVTGSSGGPEVMPTAAGAAPAGETGGAGGGSAGATPWKSAAALGSYTARFTVEFTGATSWSYLLLTRSTPTLTEQSLHIEGIEAARNPGDVRMVSDGSTMWMTGAGTDNDCVRFPLGQGLDPKLITPETLLPPEALAAMMRPAREEVFLGRLARHYTAGGGVLLDWQITGASLTQDAETGALLALEVTAQGQDGFFGMGSGTLTARYRVDDLSEPRILPVEGCGASLPLPEGISGYVQLPGLQGFESQQAAEELVRFFQERLAQEGWTESAPPARTEKAWVLSYARGSESVGIQIEPRAGGGSQVKIMMKVSE